MSSMEMDDNNSYAPGGVDKIVLFPHGKKLFRQQDWPCGNFLQSLNEEHHNVQSFIRFERDQHSPLSVQQLVLSCWIDEWEEIDINALGNDSLAVWCLLNSNQPEDVQLEKVKVLLQRGEIHVAVAILLGLRLVKEAVETYMVKGYLFDAQLLIELKFSNGDESSEVPMAHLLASHQQNAQQVAKPGLYIDTDLPLRKESRTLTPITKGYKKPWVPKRLETIEEN
ncbi:hypothetical protein VE01_09440 [Pseudogymnoascus verrucosus]|uniref:Uncharacterized protein n=1 Tax=Pseudogymnoascus verrucosus TaxID=342668 RepID=A0A1B8G9P5_9PEZI|nr:uncharacterized protein VE01_09440 [Pseudogymnoascus verrucosus]OBT92556.1 hypothetical protein VE01_09440 [Pseudogymnoascus verrucosus]